MSIKSADLIILGAGAAGLMASIVASSRDKNVLLIDHAAMPGRKLLASGGGKCNVTNLKISENDFFGLQPEFCIPALSSFSSDDCLKMLETAKIPTEERDFGRIFCKNSAKDLVSFLQKKATYQGVRFAMKETILKVEKIENTFFVSTQREVFSAKQILIATGGLAWPQIGATNLGMKIAKEFGHKILPLRPALTGFVLAADSPLLNLQGISLPVQIWLKGDHQKSVKASKDFCTERESLLFTHKGLSGPASLQASCAWNLGQIIYINFLPDMDVAKQITLPENGRLSIKNIFARHLPERLFKALVPQEIALRKIAEISKTNIHNVVQNISAFPIIPTATEGFDKAETTLGGVDTGQINPLTMESRIVPKLYFAGEVLDIAGKLGGYNIHWAFASGKMVGLAI